MHALIHSLVYLTHLSSVPWESLAWRARLPSKGWPCIPWRGLNLGGVSIFSHSLDRGIELREVLLLMLLKLRPLRWQNVRISELHLLLLGRCLEEDLSPLLLWGYRSLYRG